jgi:hypothetical protein
MRPLLSVAYAFSNDETQHYNAAESTCMYNKILVSVLVYTFECPVGVNCCFACLRLPPPPQSWFSGLFALLALDLPSLCADLAALAVAAACMQSCLPGGVLLLLLLLRLRPL